jgi:hypothetical protein
MFFSKKKPDCREGLRTCEVDGDKAFFHMWVKSGLPTVCAIIEYLDGTIDLVLPERLKFTDR